MKSSTAIALTVLTVLFFFLVGCNGESTIMPPSESVSADTIEQNARQTLPGEPAKLTLYTMSECPFGTKAETIIHKVKQVLGDDLDVRLVFIVSKDDQGELHSLHGSPELEKDLIQICVGEIDAKKQLDFVIRMNELNGDWEKTVEEMGISFTQIEACMRGNIGPQIIFQHLNETQTLGINASPTIVINGTPYNNSINSRDLFDTICATFQEGSAPAACGNPPEILSRTDSDLTGKCSSEEEEKLPEEMVVDASFVHTVLFHPDSFSDERMEEILQQTESVFPNIQIEKVDATGRQGKKMIEKYHLTHLPAYIFPTEIAQYENFKHMERYLKKMADIYLLDPTIGGNLFLNRERKPKVVDIFYTPFSNKAMRVLLDIADLLTRPEIQAKKFQINLRPFAVIDNGQMTTQMGPPEMEEMLRQIAIMEKAPAQIWPYLRLRYENPSSSWWEDYVTKVSLEPARIKKLAQAEATRKKLLENSRLAGETNLLEEINFLIENCELARIEGKEQFRQVLLKLGQR